MFCFVERSNLGKDSKNLAKHPPNSGVDIWFMRFHYWAILKNCIFSIVLEPFFPLKD